MKKKIAPKKANIEVHPLRIRKTLTNILVLERDTRKETEYSLAKKLGMTVGHYKDVEGGRCSMDKLISILGELGINIKVMIEIEYDEKTK